MSEPICACGHHQADHETVDWDGNGPFCGICWLDEQHCGEYCEALT